jgi:N-acetylglucosaminyldiphosphoundecaprenol N-acetyl-beta-D-mannosaminyltransferase
MITSTEQHEIAWPPKQDLFGVGVSVADCQTACDAIMQAARRRSPAVVSAFSVHALVEATNTADRAREAGRFAIVTPDGQPIRWALNWLGKAGLARSLQGYEVMLELCQRSIAENVGIYLYGSSPETLAALSARLRERFTGLRIVGEESPPFRPLTPEEDAAMVERINSSGAGLVFLGLGCPKQDHFAAAHLDRIQAVQLCVGAAFDFLSGNKELAPDWMQRHGLAWLFRLYQEPGRLWKRYLVTNTQFILRCCRQWIRQLLGFRTSTHPAENIS